jgi:hypothetical protein
MDLEEIVASRVRLFWSTSSGTNSNNRGSLIWFTTPTSCMATGPAISERTGTQKGPPSEKKEPDKEEIVILVAK